MTTHSEVAGGPPLVEVVRDIAEEAMVAPLTRDLNHIVVTDAEEEAWRDVPITEEHVIEGDAA